MSSLVVIDQQIKEKRRGGGGTMFLPAYIALIGFKRAVQAKCQNATVSQHILLQ